MISIQPPRTLRIRHRRKKRKRKYKHGLVLLTLFWGILVGAGARAYFEETPTSINPVVPYTEVAEPTIQDANRLAEIYTALILQAQADPSVMDKKEWVDGTESAIREMDHLIGRLRDTETSSEALRLHRKNTIEAYALYATAMEDIRNGLLIHSDSLIEEGERMIDLATSLVNTMTNTIPY